MMNPETFNILDQLAGAISLARDTGKMVYVFEENDKWWYCGSMPKHQPSCYIVYPNGDFDQMGAVKKIAMSDWSEYCARVDATFTPSPERKKKKAEVNLKGYKKIFVAYCAFAPYFAVAMAMAFEALFGMTNFWQFAFISALACVPLSLVFALVALHRPKDGRIASFASMLAVDAHLLFYGGIWLIAYHEYLKNDAGVAIGISCSLIMSAISLLMLWDNEKKPEPIPS